MPYSYIQVCKALTRSSSQASAHHVLTLNLLGTSARRTATLATSSLLQNAPWVLPAAMFKRVKRTDPPKVRKSAFVTQKNVARLRALIVSGAIWDASKTWRYTVTRTTSRITRAEYKSPIVLAITTTRISAGWTLVTASAPASRYQASLRKVILDFR